MATKALTITYGADAKGVQTALDSIDKSHASTTSKFAALSGSFGMLKGSLGELAAGFGPMGEAASKAGEGIDHVKEKFSELEGGAQKAGAVMVGAGAALTGIGALGVAIGEKQEQASKTLEVAVKNTGASYDEYAKSIGQAVTAGEKNAHNAADTKDALAKLTTALGDPKKALDDMSLAEEIAAKKHIDLSSAADQVLKIHQGASKVLKQFGIDATAASGASKALAADQKADEAAVKAATTATESAAATQEKLVTKYGLTAAGAKELAAAHAAVNVAMASGDPNKVLTAESALENQAYKLSAGLKMNQADTDLLAKARYDLQQKGGALEAADTKLAAAQDAASKATAQGSYESQVMAKIHGTAAAQADTFGGKIAALKTHLMDMAGSLGAQFGPALTKLGPLMMGLGAIMESNLIPQVLTIGGEIVGTGVMWVSSWLSMMAGTVSAMIGIDISTGGLLLILGAIIAGVLLVWKNWSAIWGWIQDAFHATVDFIKSHVELLLGLFLPFLLPFYEIYKHWGEIWSGMEDVLQGFLNFWSAVWGLVQKVLSDVWGFIKPIIDGIKGGINDVVGAIKAVAGVGGTIGHMLGFQAGGTVPGPIGAPMLAVVHGGEQISPVGSPGAAAGGGDIYVNVVVQGNAIYERNLTNSIYEGLLEIQRRQGTLAFH